MKSFFVKKKNRILFAAVLCLVCAVLVVFLTHKKNVQEGENLILNSNFEEGLSHWSEDAWQTEEGITVFSFLKGEGMDGSDALFIENNAANDARFAQTVSVQPNTLYHLHGYIKAEATGGLGANLSVKDVYSFSDSVYDSKGEWQEVSLYGRTGSEQTVLTLFARLGGYSGEAKGKAWFNNVSLEQVDSVPSGYYEKQLYPAQTQKTEDSSQSGTAAGGLVAAAVLFILLCIVLRRKTEENALKNHQENKTKFRLILSGLLLLAALIRVYIAVKVHGYDVDVNDFLSWARHIAEVGPAQFYSTVGFCDYPPGYLLILWPMGALSRLFNSMSPLWIKIPPILCDLLTAFTLYKICVRKGKKQTAAIAVAVLAALNPLSLMSGSAWGQSDSVMTFLLLLVVLFALDSRWSLALPLYMAAVLVKPQALMFGPMGLAALVMDFLRIKTSNEKTELSTFWKNVLLGVGFALLVAAVIVVPFSVGQGGIFWLFELYGNTMGFYAYATVNACNVYFLFGLNWVSTEAMALQEGGLLMLLCCFAAFALPPLLCAGVRGKYRTESKKYAVITAVCLLCMGSFVALAFFGSLTLGVFGGVMLGFSLLFSLFLLVRSKDIKHLPLLGATMLCLIFSYSTMMHERYLFPAVFLFLLAYILEKDKRILWLMAGVTVVSFLNIGCVLDRNIRIGGSSAHLTAPAYNLVSDMGVLEMLSAAGCILIAMASSFVSVDLCVFGHVMETGAVSLQEETLLEPDAMQGVDIAMMEPVNCSLNRKMDKRDWLIMLLCTALYAGLAFTNLGSVKAPQTSYTFAVDKIAPIIFDLGEDSVFSFRYHTGENPIPAFFTLETSQDANTWKEVSEEYVAFENDHQWITILNEEYTSVSLPIYFSGRYIRIKTDYSGLQLAEIECLDESGSPIFLLPIDGDAQTLIDEQTAGTYTATPQTVYTFSNHSTPVILDLGMETEFTMLHYNNIQRTDGVFTVEVSSDGKDWQYVQTVTVTAGDCFKWQYVTEYASVPAVFSGRYLRLTASQTGNVNLFEVLCRSAEGETLPLTVVSGDEGCFSLADEQDTLQGEPGWYNSAYFDEIYHARTGYETLHGLSIYEWTHPPLGKNLMALCIAVFGMTPFGWRFAGALMGVLMLPGMYMLGRQLFKKRFGAILSMLLMTFDLMHFTQTRIATIDSFVVCFIIWAYVFMLRYFFMDFSSAKKWKTFVPLMLSGIFMGLAVASKWTGCYAGVGLAVLFFVRIFRRWKYLTAIQRKTSPMQAPIKEKDAAEEKKLLLYHVLSCLVFFVLVPAVIYYASYIPFFASRGGVSLSGIIHETESMLNYHSTPGLGMDHSFYSPWYQWPLSMKPMWYYSSSYAPEGSKSTIMAMGNPAVWWVGAAAMIVLFAFFAQNHIRRDGTVSLQVRRNDPVSGVILVSFLAQFLPWVLVPRGTYIYHYFASVPFVILATVKVWEMLSEKNEALGKWAAVLQVALAVLLFVGFFPYASGVTVPIKWLDFMKWFPNWLWY